MVEPRYNERKTEEKVWARVRSEEKHMNVGKKPKISHAGVTFLLVVMIGFFLGSIVYILNQAATKDKKSASINQQIEDQEEVVEVQEQEANLCVLKEIDITEQTVVLYDVVKDYTVKLTYTGGTDIRDKYSQVISASQLVLGDMVEAVYNESNQTLKSLMNSPKTWEYTNVTELSPDRANKIIKLYGEKYKYTSKLYVRTPDGESALLSINGDDVLTVRGYEKTIYSITVTKGHGSIVLKDSQYFEGGNLTIGGKEYYDITSDMVFTVREGTVKITVEKDDIKGSTTVEVLRNEEVEVDLSVFAPNPEEKGEVSFIIYPFGAELLIDNVLTSYANPLELTYGEHTIEVVLDGYETYAGTYVLNQSTDVVQIELPETTSTEDDETNESQDTSVDSNTTGQTTGTTGQTSGTNTGSEENSNTSSPDSKEDTSSSNIGNQKEAEGDDSGESYGTENEVDSEHTISIQGPVGVSIYINGVYKGIAPLKLEKPLGMTYITLLKEGYQQITHTVNIKDDEEDKYYSFPSLELEED